MSFEASRLLASHIVDLDYTDIDETVIEHAKWRVLDLLGCTIAGAAGPGNHGLLEVLRSTPTAPQATVLIYGDRVSAVDAARINAAMSRSYDHEVMTVVYEGRTVPSHNSPTTVMTALAMCQRVGATGKDFLAAVILGDDLAARLLAASSFNLSVWDGTATYTAPAATAIAARLLGLDAPQTHNALGLVVNQIGGNVQAVWDGATSFKLGQATAAANGIFSAELAQHGWIGVSDPIGNFFDIYTDGLARPQALTTGLGERFYYEQYFKRYPACMATHPVIECAMDLAAELHAEAIPLGTVDTLEVSLPPRFTTMFCAKPLAFRADPVCDALFSFQFMVADALLNGTVTRSDYQPDALSNPALRDLASRVRLVPDPELSPSPQKVGTPVRITASTAHRTIRAAVAGVRWHPDEAPIGYLEVLEKFWSQIEFARTGREGDAQRLVELVGQLEDLEDLEQLTAATVLQGQPLPITASARPG